MCFFFFCDSSRNRTAFAPCANARVRIPHPKIDKLACQAQGAGIFAVGEIPGFICTSYEVLFSFFGDPSAQEHGAQNFILARSGSHSPLEDRGARSPGVERANIRATREIPDIPFKLLDTSFVVDAPSILTNTILYVLPC